MLLESIEAHNFRNLRGSIKLCSGLNILVGENGQGKTNWLEAASILGSLRSFRTSRLQECVAFGESAAWAKGSVRESPEIVRELQVAVTGSLRTPYINGKKEPPQRYLGHLYTVVFNADELGVVRGQPEERRRWLDAGIVSLHPPFIQVMADYARVIKQKNALLASARDSGMARTAVTTALEPWNEQLARLAAKVHRARVRYVERINEMLSRELFDREKLTLAYRSSLEGKGDLGRFEELMAERLAMRVEAELVSGHALIGTHRDDMDIAFDGHDIRKFGSAGQQRSALLLLQLANMAVFNATRGEYPVFLIDDIDAELDYRRIGKLLETLAEKTQTIVTTSKDSFVENFGSDAAVFRVSAGLAEPA